MTMMATTTSTGMSRLRIGQAATFNRLTSAAGASAGCARRVDGTEVAPAPAGGAAEVADVVDDAAAAGAEVDGAAGVAPAPADPDGDAVGGGEVGAGVPHFAAGAGGPGGTEPFEAEPV